MFQGWTQEEGVFCLAGTMGYAPGQCWSILFDSEPGSDLRDGLPSKNHGFPDMVMDSGVGMVLGASVTTFPSKPQNGPKPIPMKIQANFRFSFSPNMKLWVGFLPELEEALPVHPSPGIISLHVASLGFSCCLIP